MERHKLWEERASKLMKKLFENQGINVSIGKKFTREELEAMPFGEVVEKAEELGWEDTYGDAEDEGASGMDAMEEECIQYILKHQ